MAALWRFTQSHRLRVNETALQVKSTRQIEDEIRGSPGCHNAKVLGYNLTGQTDDKLQIRAHLMLPSKQNSGSGVVVYCPCETRQGFVFEDCIRLAQQVLPLGLAVCNLDTTPSGASCCCAESIVSCLDVLRAGLPGRNPYKCIALWGRSLGAVAAMACAARDPDLAALVSDGAYSDLASLVVPTWVSAPLAGLASWTSTSVPEVSFNGFERQPVDNARLCHMPALFLHGSDDGLLPPVHAKTLRQVYAGEAQIFIMPRCDHDSVRPSDVYARGALFLARALHIENATVDKLVTFLAGASSSETAMEAKIKKAVALLSSKSDESHRDALLLRARIALPLYDNAIFSRVMVKGRWKIRPTGMADVVRYRTLVTLPSPESEVIIAWAHVDHPAEAARAGLASEVVRGCVHLAVISCHHLSLTQTQVRLMPGMDGGRGEGSAAVHDLACQPVYLQAQSVPYSATLSLHRSGRIELCVSNTEGLTWSPPGGGKAPWDSAIDGGISVWRGVFTAVNQAGCVEESGSIQFLQSKGEMQRQAQDVADAKAVPKDEHLAATERGIKVRTAQPQGDHDLPASAAEMCMQGFSNRPGRVAPPQLHTLELVEEGLPPSESLPPLETLPTLLTDISERSFLTKADTLALSQSTENSDLTPKSHAELLSVSSGHTLESKRVTISFDAPEALEYDSDSSSDSLPPCRTWPEVYDSQVRLEDLGHSHSLGAVCELDALPPLHPLPHQPQL